MEDLLDKITEFADKAHGGQMRKYTPERYIVHPVRVMNMCKPYTNNVAVLAAALLHDVLEDTPTTKEEITDFLQTLMSAGDAARTITLVVELTDVYVKEAYPKWNRRKRKSAEQDRMARTSVEAQTIKYADIIDNCTEIVRQDVEFAPVFLRECRALLKRMTNGNSELYNKAMEVVDGGLASLNENR